MTGLFNKGMRSEFDDEVRPAPQVPMLQAEAPDPLLAKMRNLNRAHLPAVYEAVKAQIASVTTVDEAREWDTKAEAMRGWARLYADTEVGKLIKRVKAHARRRAGQIQNEIDKAAKAEESAKKGFSAPPGKNPKGGRPRSAGRAAARSAGLSDEQIESAQKVARVPDAQFRAMVDEAEEPATIEELEIAGRKPPKRGEGVEMQPTDGPIGARGEPIRKSDYKEANGLMAFLKEARRALKLDPAKAFAVMTTKERATALAGLAEVADYCTNAVRVGGALDASKRKESSAKALSGRARKNARSH